MKQTAFEQQRIVETSTMEATVTNSETMSEIEATDALIKKQIDDIEREASERAPM